MSRVARNGNGGLKMTIGMTEKQWFAGVDWASEKHRVHLIDGSGKRLGERWFRHGGAGLAEMADWLIATSGGAPSTIHVAIEVPHGPIVETLLERGFNVYAINPKQLDRFRDRFSPAGAKDDDRDAEVLAGALRTDMRAFRKVVLADALLVELREWSRMADDLSADKNRLANRLREQLWRYYPQMLELEADITAEWMLDLWEALPTPAKAARVRESTVKKILKDHRIRRIDAVQALAILRKPAVVVAPGTTEAATAHIHTLIASLRLVNEQLKGAHRQLEILCARLAEPVEKSDEEAEAGQISEQRDAAILASMPGNGRIVLATLLAEAWDALQRRDYHALRALCGVAPVTKRSGKSRIVIRRLACHPRLRNAAYHWAGAAIQYDDRSRAKYDALRARGHSHARALRSVADRLLAVACAMLKNGTLFDSSLAHAN
jgi:transposase